MVNSLSRVVYGMDKSGRDLVRRKLIDLRVSDQCHEEPDLSILRAGAYWADFRYYPILATQVGNEYHRRGVA